jgi:hypothetical protein
MDDKPKPIRYHTLFDCDVREAAAWYDKRAPGLGDSFTTVVRQRVDDVIAHPLRFSKSDAGCHYAQIRRFPYVVLYDVTDTEILMLGVLHTARSMEKWRERMESE